jgi:hypothetical protein
LSGNRGIEVRLAAAKREARKTARREGVAIVVTFNPFDEETLHDRDGGYGFFPKAAIDVFGHEVLLEEIAPNGDVKDLRNLAAGIIK